MLSLVDSDAAGAPATVAGRLFAASSRIAVLSLPLPTSLPIPLGTGAPGLDLVTWAFAGLDPADTAGPRALLVLAARDGATGLHEAGTIGVATHYRDLAVSTGAAESLDALPLDDRALLARALLSAAALDTVAALADLTALFEGAVIAPAADAPEVVLTGDAGRISGSLMPDYLLVRREAGWACLRVARVRLAFAPEPHATLTLAPVWGPPGRAVEAAILLSAQSFTPARIGAAR